VAVSFIETTDLPQVNDKLKETFLEAKHVTGLESISGDLENQLNINLKLFIILYADDTVILSESESDLQAQLDAFHEYCLTWKLKVNHDQTKIIEKTQ
jgi:hypothetical protein